MRADFWVAIFLALFGSTITAVPVPLSDRSSQLNLTEHRKRVQQFRCEKPQLRSYKIMQILPLGQLETTELILPVHTVIRRCDEGAGCCVREGQVCGPAAVDGLEYETVDVKVSNVVKNTTSGVIKTLQIEHHKRCECQDRSEQQPSKPKITLLG